MWKKLNVDVSFRYSDAETEDLTGKTVIVIDVLRCTSVMITALENGCERIIPVLEPAEAEALADALGRTDCVLGGERGCNKLPGFDVGNSPLEYVPSVVSGKTVIITTSNGTNAIRRASGGDTVLIGALINKTAVANAALSIGADIHIVCSGTAGKVSADDIIAAGGIIDSLCELAVKAETAVCLSDSAIVSTVMYEEFTERGFDLVRTSHCARLVSLGYGKDVEYCVTEDTSLVVPAYSGGEIRVVGS